MNRDLTNKELIQTRPNRRVVRIETYNSYNKKGKPFQVLCKDETLNHKGATPVTIYEGVWWYLKKGSSKQNLRYPNQSQAFMTSTKLSKHQTLTPQSKPTPQTTHNHLKQHTNQETT